MCLTVLSIAKVERLKRMPSGEPDGTQRIKAVVQYTASDLRSSIYGTLATTQLTDEGTEGDADSWVASDGDVTFSNEGVIHNVGSYCLQVDVGAVASKQREITFEISEAITWENFLTFSFELYRDASPQAPFIMYMGIETSDGLQAFLYKQGGIWMPSAVTWKSWTLEKGDFGFIDSGIAALSEITKVWIAFQHIPGYTAHRFYIDNISFTASSGIYQVSVDANGRLQVNMVNADGDIITPALEGGNLAAIKTATEATQTAVELIDNAIDGSEMQVDIVGDGGLAQESGGNLADIKTNLDTPTTIGHGANSDIDTSAEQIDPTSIACKAVMVQAHKDNTDTIWIGGSGVTTDNGIGLEAGEAIAIAVSNVNKVYAIAEANDQKASYIYVN